MLDTHNHPLHNWGIKPVLFHFGNFTLYSYPTFITLAIITGFLSYFLYYRKYQKNQNENSILVILFGFMGSILGAKIPIWILYYKQILENFPNIGVILSGRTITGGLIGGVISMKLAKKKFGINKRIGNALVPSILLGMMVGRIGCFLRGCCYGKPTDLPWGVDFGDNIQRHPTQIYEIIFLAILFIYSHSLLKKNPNDGILFDNFLLLYFTFRFFIEFIRIEDKLWLNLTLFQYISIIVIIYVLSKKVIKK